MNDPTYILQGEQDPESSETPLEDVWVRREDSDVTCTTFNDDDGNYKRDTVHMIYRETVLLGPEQETFPPDHYDIIDDSCLEDETELKQLVNDNKTNSRNAQPRLYHELPTQSAKNKRLQRRPDYENMVKIFKPLLVENVIVRRLLPHLLFLSNPDRIRAIEERDPRAAVIYLIDELCSNSNREPGRWRQFIQALEMCGYKYIVDTLRGQDPVDHTYQREYLKIITPILRELITPSEILPILWGFDVLSNEDNEEIGRIERNLGPIEAATKLLGLVPRRHKYWYSHLVDALRVAKKHEAADMLAIPEILNFDGLQKDELKKYNSEKLTDKETKTSLVKKSTQIRYNNEGDSASTERNTSFIYVPDNCEYLDCENDSDNDTYLSMNTSNFHNGRNKPYLENIDSVNRQTATLNQPNDQEEDRFSLYEEQSLPPIPSFMANVYPSEISLTENQGLRSEPLNDKRSDSCQPDEDNSYKYCSTVQVRDGDSTAENKEGCRMDVYKYEPPLPSSIAPEMPGQNENNDVGSPEIEMYSDAEIRESYDVEVIPLSVSTRKNHRRYYSYTAKYIRTQKTMMSTHMTGKEDVPPDVPKRNRSSSHGKANYKRTNKSPMPTPVIETEDVPPSLPKRNHSSPHVKANFKRTPKEPMPTPLTEEDVPPCLPKRNHSSPSNKGTVIDKPPRAAPRKRKEECKNAFTHGEKNDEERACPSTSENEEGTDDGGSAYVISEEEGIKQEETTQELRKNHKNFFELTERDKQRKTGKALINRDRMPTPKAVRKQYVDTDGSKVLQDHNTTKDLKQVLGSNKEDVNTCEQPSAYSDPFRSHRGKEDEDIFTTVRQVRYDGRWSANCTKDVISSRLLQTAHFNATPRKRSKSDELLGILESCNIECKSEDYILKSDVNIKTVTKDNLSSELRKGLENVRDMEKKLINLVHGERVLKKKLQLQGDINEVLKQHRSLSRTLTIKEKEAKALEEAITGGTQDLAEDIYSPFDSEEFYARAELQRRGQCPYIGTYSVSKNEDLSTAEITGYTGNNVAEVEEVKDKITAVEKDSAFYSTYTTKL